MTEQEYYDLTIIGGGPVGMFAATYARMRLAKTQIIESLDSLGGQVSALFHQKKSMTSLDSKESPGRN